MGKRDPRIDAYIAKAPEFAKPILTQIRDVVHDACPGVEEDLKWSSPAFMYKGILCSMAAFKAHCAFGFWKGKLLAEKHQALADTREFAMGEFGRITALSDLPGEKTLLRYVKEAAALNDQGVKHPTRAKPKGKQKLKVPDYFLAALQKSRKALVMFEGFNYNNKKDYVEWVTEAKGEETRRRRLETAVAWMSEGKARNWKYMTK